MNNFKNFEHIAGYHKEKSELIGLRNLLTNVENFRKSGVRMPRGVLLYGAPGVGKTVMATLEARVTTSKRCSTTTTCSTQCSSTQ